MRIVGYRPLGERHETDAFHMQMADELGEFLRIQAKGGNRQHVKKVSHTLELIKRNGLRGAVNNTLFVQEGRFSVKQPGKSDISIYAAKAYQLRVYGGLVRINGESVFLCPEGAIKQRDSADQTQLKRVAEILGRYDER